MHFCFPISSYQIHYCLSYIRDGILIEANPTYFKTILQTKRRDFMLNACLSPTRKATTLNFTQYGLGGGLTDLISIEQREFFSYKRKPIEIQCFPLYSIMSALEIERLTISLWTLKDLKLKCYKIFHWMKELSTCYRWRKG